MNRSKFIKLTVAGLCSISACSARSGSEVAGTGSGGESGSGGVERQGYVPPKPDASAGGGRGLGIAPMAIYRPQVADKYHYNHNVMVMPFNGYLYVMWGAAPKDEDTNVDVVYSRSKAALASASGTPSDWGVPAAGNSGKAEPYRLLQPTKFGPDALNVQSAGWWKTSTTLIAYVDVFFSPYDPRVYQTVFLESTDGVTWTAPKPLTDLDGKTLEASIQESPKRLPSGRLVATFNRTDPATTGPGAHGARMVQTPYFTDDPTGTSGWRRGDFTNAWYTINGQGAESEGSIYFGPGDDIVAVYRDMDRAKSDLLASTSTNAGLTWSSVVQFVSPIGQNKASVGNFANGDAYVLWNPQHPELSEKSPGRYPLMVTTFSNGILKTTSKQTELLGAADVTPLRFPGQWKTSGFSYPNSMVEENVLYVAYARNKEDVEVLRVPVAAIDKP